MLLGDGVKNPHKARSHPGATSNRLQFFDVSQSSAMVSKPSQNEVAPGCDLKLPAVLIGVCFLFCLGGVFSMGFVFVLLVCLLGVCPLLCLFR